MKRRDFFKTSLATVAGAAAFATDASAVGLPVDNRKISDIPFPEKRPLITYSDRPPLLETPKEYFTCAHTPNDLFFVRWHMPDIPTHIDSDKFTINIDGEVDKKLSITLDQLKNDFEQVTVSAVMQCGGNGRSAFKPTPGGIQWGNGAMGCAKWKGVRLRDILERAGLKPGAEWVGFNGEEKAAYYKTPNFVRELHLDEIGDHVIIAYEMNGEDLPYLNGYPVRLVIPGYYSDSWVKMLSRLTVTKDYQHLFFMDYAYRVPDNATESQKPGEKVKTKPITKMNVKSVIGYPTPGMKLYHKSHVTVRGVAFDHGAGIRKVEISLDGGKSWHEAQLGEDEGRYAYRTFHYTFKPLVHGKMTIMSRATNHAGEQQPMAEEIGWNAGGYKYNGVDVVHVEVV